MARKSERFWAIRARDSGEVEQEILGEVEREILGEEEREILGD